MGLIKILFSIFKLTLAISFIAIILAFYLWIPSYQGEIIYNRKYGDIIIYRDENAIPHIVADNIVNLKYGLGYAHCQDRLWNMDIHRRIASGRMSELFGNSTLDTDIMMREFGIKHTAQKTMKTLSKECLQIFQAYADGINDCAASMKLQPLEYYITGTTFKKWEIIDTVYFIKLLNFQLSTDWPYELMREKLSKLYGRAAAEQMMGNRNLFDDTTIMTDDELKIMGLYKQFDPLFNTTKREEQGSSLTTQQLELVMKTGIIDYLLESRGSNGWVIHGNYTTTGKPILANDPHLDNLIPSVWYETVLHFKSNKGGSMPASSAVLSGMTNYFAWSMTTLYTDTCDLYEEKLNENGTQYYLDGKWVNLKIDVEPIYIKDHQTYNITIKQTHRGPIIKKDQMNVSLNWIGNVEQDRSMEGILNFYHIDSYEELIKNFDLLDSPTQALAYATVDNHIGFYGMGRHPIRSNPYQGAFIQNGTLSKNDWIRFNTKQEQPRLYDPPKGYVVTANNKFGSDNTLNNLSISVSTTSRARRITQFIEQYIRNGTKISPEHIMNMQNDVLDSFAEKIHPHILTIYQKYKKEILTTQQVEICDKMMKILEKWDYYVEQDSIGASIYYSIDYFLGKKILPQYSETESERYKVTYHFLFDHFRLNQIKNWSEGKNLNEIWCQNQKQNASDKQCIQIYIQSIYDAHTFLSEKFGTDMNKWQYGQLHQHKFINIPFSKTPLKFLFERSYPSKGSRYTVHVSSKDFYNDSWNGIYGGNYKMIASLDLTKSDSYYIIDTGISGNILSSHYDDQQQIYKQGKYLKQNRNKETYSKYQKTILKQAKNQSKKESL